MRFPQLFGGDVEDVAQAEIVLPPPRDVAVKEGLEGLGGPGGGVHPVGDGVHRVVGEHQPGHLAVLLGHPVDVVAQVEGQVGHIQPEPPLGQFGDPGEFPAILEDMFLDIHAEGVLHIHHVPEVAPHFLHQLQRKLVVPRGHRRVGGEDALVPDRFNLGLADAGLAVLLRRLVQAVRWSERPRAPRSCGSVSGPGTPGPRACGRRRFPG